MCGQSLYGDMGSVGGCDEPLSSSLTSVLSVHMWPMLCVAVAAGVTMEL